MPKSFEMTCEQCGARFAARRSTRRYCSGRCRQAAHAGRIELQHFDRTCARCGGRIPPHKRADARYCDEACRAAAGRHRRSLG